MVVFNKEAVRKQIWLDPVVWATQELSPNRYVPVAVRSGTTRRWILATHPNTSATFNQMDQLCLQAHNLMKSIRITRDNYVRRGVAFPYGLPANWGQRVSHTILRTFLVLFKFCERK